MSFLEDLNKKLYWNQKLLKYLDLNGCSYNLKDVEDKLKKKFNIKNKIFSKIKNDKELEKILEDNKIDIKKYHIGSKIRFSSLMCYIINFMVIDNDRPTTLNYSCTEMQKDLVEFDSDIDDILNKL